mgnify:CR=1 FL=1
MAVNLEKIKTFLGGRDGFAEIQTVAEANKYLSYEHMAIDDKQATTVVDGVEYDLTEDVGKWVNSKLRFGYLNRIVRQRVSYAFGRKCTFSKESDQISVLFDMDTIRKCGWYIAAHGHAFLEIRFNEDGVMSGICAHDPAHCFEFNDSETTQRAFVVLEEVRNEFGLKSEDEQLQVRVIEESQDKSSFTITQYLYANNDIKEVDYIKPVTVQRRNDGKLRKFNGDLVMELFTDPFKTGVFTEIKSLVDEYDTVASETSDYLKKSPRSPIVLKGYGTNVTEFVSNLFEYNVIPLQADGTAELLKCEQDVTAVCKHLDNVEQAMREQTGWVKTELGNIGYSGAALRMRYADLDIHAQHLQSVLKEAFDSCRLYVIDAISGITDDVEVAFDSDVMVNESDTVTNCVNSMDILSHRTILENHPFVSNVDVEISRLEEEGRSIYTIGEAESEAESEAETDAESESNGLVLNPVDNLNVSNKQKKILAENT